MEYKIWLVARSINKIRARQVFRKTILKSKPDLIHIFIPWSGFETTRLYLSHVHRLPTILSVRNAFPKTNWSPWHRRHYQEAFHSVRGVYAISQSALDLFKDLYGEFIRAETVLDVIHNSVDTRRFIPDRTKRKTLRDALCLPRDAHIIGFVGRIEKQKRPEALIDVFFDLRRRFSSIYLVLVGSGPLEGKIRQRVAELGLSGSVRFVGWQSRVEDFIPGFDVVLQLSNNEGFGTTTIEAMACGVPVVGTDVPGTRDILKKGLGGILVPLERDGEAAEACTRLLADDSLRRDLGASARREAVQNYDESAWERHILEFYERVLGNGQAG